MRRTTTSIASTAAAFALVVGLAACGSSGGSDSDKETTTTEASGGGDETTTSTADDDTATTEEDATTTVVATGGGDFCDELADYINETSATDVDVTDPDAYKKAVEESSERGRDVLSEAPDELDDAVETILDAQDQLVAELEKVDFDFSKLPADAMSGMSSSEVVAAGEELDTYLADTCGIALETPEVDGPEMPDVTAATIPAG